MAEQKISGFCERAHTADWAMEVWSPDLAGLIRTAAAGLYALTETRLAPGPRLRQNLHLPPGDIETWLVSFLSELLYLAEAWQTSYDEIDVTLSAEGLDAKMEGSHILSQSKEVKAITYHNLAVTNIDGLYRVTLTMDV